MVEWIIPNAQKNMMEPIRVTLAAGGSTYPDLPHEGEEFGYVLSGTIYIVLGDRTLKAKKGESFYFRPDTNHYIKAEGEVRSFSSWLMNPLESSQRSASSSCVSPFLFRKSLILFPISIRMYNWKRMPHIFPVP